MLDSEGIQYRYRDYVREPLSEGEIGRVLELLGVTARDLLRRRDKAFGPSGLTGDEPDDELVAAMARHPTLLQRPIGLAGGKAVLGRPPERLLELA